MHLSAQNAGKSEASRYLRNEWLETDTVPGVLLATFIGALSVPGPKWRMPQRAELGKGASE